MDNPGASSHSSLPRVWPQLLPELAERIACCLAGNERACSLRLVNRAAAEQFRGPQHTTIRLSQPVPVHAFARHWGAPGSTRGLSLTQRQQLMSLPAASGSIPNMEVAMAAAGCPPLRRVQTASAAAGQLAVCKWLLKTHPQLDAFAMLEAAAESEQMHIVEWIKGLHSMQRAEDAHDITVRIVKGAARGGRTRLLEQLLRDCRHDFRSLHKTRKFWILEAASYGCDLPMLERLHSECLDDRGGSEAVLEWYQDLLLAAAAGSPTADWQAKVEWLERKGYPRTHFACCAAAGCSTGDAVDRLIWLRQRGYDVGSYAARIAAQAGNLAALQYLHAEGVWFDGAALVAAEAGHLPVVAWLVETPGVAVPLAPRLFNAAARSGSLELLAWLHERGCPWDGKTFAEAAAGGNDVALEWLLERGFPMPGDGSPHWGATVSSDLATLRTLRRLGCPWRPPGVVLGQGGTWIDMEGPTLRWLLEEGCPVDWEAIDATRSTQDQLSACQREALETLLQYRP